MRIIKIFSDRHYNTWPSWQIVYEWEDEISLHLQIPIENSPNEKSRSVKEFLKRTGRKIFKRDFSVLSSEEIGKEEVFLYFEMRPKNYHSFSNSKNAVPVIIDFWNKDKIEDFKKYYKDCPRLLVTSLEVINFLKKENFPGKLLHFPMSLPDKYRIKTHVKFEKEFDVILAGRINPVLLRFFEEYLKEHPDLEYVYRQEAEGKFSYFSNKKGLLGDFESREAYFSLLSKAKIAFYATPGMDDEKGRTGGFNPVTPRLFEILAAGCDVIMRYPENEEAEYFRLSSLNPSAKNYQIFKQQMDKAIDAPSPIERNSDYLKEHYTSTRLKIIQSLK